MLETCPLEHPLRPSVDLIEESFPFSYVPDMFHNRVKSGQLEALKGQLGHNQVDFLATGATMLHKTDLWNPCQGMRGACRGLLHA